MKGVYVGSNPIYPIFVRLFFRFRECEEVFRIDLTTSARLVLLES